MDDSARVVGVLGASGGVGASTLAAALAWRAGRRGAAVLVDGQLDGGGIDVTAGVEHLPGLRWGDLADLRGSAGAVLAELPEDRGVRVLAAGRGATPQRRPVPDSAVLEVVDALAVSGQLVIDLPRVGALREQLVGRCALVLVLAGLHVRALADADAAVEALVDGADSLPAEVALVTRGPRARVDLAEAVEQHLGLPHLAHIADEDRVVRAAERGEWPGERRTRLADTADRLIDVVLPGLIGLVS